MTTPVGVPRYAFFPLLATVSSLEIIMEPKPEFYRHGRLRANITDLMSTPGCYIVIERILESGVGSESHNTDLMTTLVLPNNKSYSPFSSTSLLIYFGAGDLNMVGSSSTPLMLCRPWWCCRFFFSRSFISNPLSILKPEWSRRS